MNLGKELKETQSASTTPLGLGPYTNGLYSRNPGILFALDKGLKSVNCSNYLNFIQKAAFYPRQNFPPLTVVYVIKDTKIQTCFLNNVWIKSSFFIHKRKNPT